ncbi:uncharacterized protein Tco025E_04203 [Trypanosoma conorhini]|uniref:Uncharacterized protein n=1 Tax=Trypanosoma conorhini TaxID=83891 RepID=A0A422PNE0_9TRYP|nr:uncharacterized protein Tco025E_04203 [Trypanosoma conorhini]RNF19249.1 hypothetical protein Tco025E_04203 [Trypanosoma conorhini]
MFATALSFVWRIKLPPSADVSQVAVDPCTGSFALMGACRWNPMRLRPRGDGARCFAPRAVEAEAFTGNASGGVVPCAVGGPLLRIQTRTEGRRGGGGGVMNAQGRKLRASLDATEHNS